MKRGLELFGVWIAGVVLIAFAQFGLLFLCGGLRENSFFLILYAPVILLTPGPGSHAYASRDMAGCVLGAIVYAMLVSSYITYRVDRKDRRP